MHGYIEKYRPVHHYQFIIHFRCMYSCSIRSSSTVHHITLTINQHLSTHYSSAYFIQYFTDVIGSLYIDTVCYDQFFP
jgi:hypothetical protein